MTTEPDKKSLTAKLNKQIQALNASVTLKSDRIRNLQAEITELKKQISEENQLKLTLLNKVNNHATY